MSAMMNREGGLAAYWDRVLAGVAVLALIATAVSYFIFCGSDVEEVVNEEVGRINLRFTQTGVEPIDMENYEAALKRFEEPVQIAPPSAEAGNFMQSSPRAFCSNAQCALPIPRGVEKCPFCQKLQAKPKPVVLDADGDGMPDAYEKAHGLNPADAADADADADSDGFTNLEEYKAGTDPQDPESHPDYLDYLSIVPGSCTTKTLPFYFTKYLYETPRGHKVEFKVPSKSADYSRGIYAVVVGEKIGETGYKLEKYEKKIEKVAIAGSNVKKERDMSVVVVVRESDKKAVRMRVNARNVAVDTQVKLAYERGATQEMTVVPGSEITLNRAKYKVVDIKKGDNQVEVKVLEPVSGQTKIFTSPLNN